MAIYTLKTKMMLLLVIGLKIIQNLNAIRPKSVVMVPLHTSGVDSSYVKLRVDHSGYGLTATIPLITNGIYYRSKLYVVNLYLIIVML